MNNEIQDKAKRIVIFSILGNLLLAFAKGITGYFGNSYALIADAIESTTDVFSSMIVYLGLRYAQKPADKNHPYGHGKIEPLITFLVVVFLILSATIIAYQSINNILSPHENPKSYTLIVLAIVIIIKEILYRKVRKKSLEVKSSSLKADAWHHRSDAITSMMAFVGISIALIAGEGYESADDWAALFASFIIMYNSYLIFRPALSEVMDEHTYPELEIKIRNLAKAYQDAKEIEKCHIRKAGMFHLVDLHLVVSANISVEEGHRISHEFKDLILHKFPEISDVFIHIEPDTL